MQNETELNKKGKGMYSELIWQIVVVFIFLLAIKLLFH